MRRAVTVFILSMCLTASAVPFANATGRRTAITDDCLHVAVRPSSIVFACADGGFLVRHLAWSTWHRERARAQGVFHQNDCHPSCAEGHMHARAGVLRVHGRRWCPDIERYVFAHAIVRFDAPLLGRDGMRFRLACPL